MEWQVGMEAVCVKNEKFPAIEPPLGATPVVNMIYKVTEVLLFEKGTSSANEIVALEDIVMLKLDGLPQTWMYDAEMFRPPVPPAKRKTDISIFQKMLLKTGKPVTA